jgi:uncharacterized protein (DUF2147 family)
MNRRPTMLLTTLAALALCSGAVAAPEISGLWATYDDHNKPTGWVRIARRAAEYYGVIERGLPSDDPQATCEACRGELHGKRVIGLEILTVHESDGGSYLGHIIDPFTGKDYRVRLTPSADGARLQVRGFIGIEIFGRTQAWLRDH